MTDFSLRMITPADIDQVADIHLASFHDGALSQLGKDVVQRYYHWLLTGFTEIIPLCAISPSHQLAGFCFAGLGGLDPSFKR